MRALLTSYRREYAGLPTATWTLSVIALVNRCGVMVLPFLLLYLTKELDFDAKAAGRLLTTYGAGALVGVYVGGWLTDRIGSLPIQTASLVGSGACFLVLGRLESEANLAAALFVTGAITESFRPANAAAVVASCPGDQTRAFALNRIAVNLGMSCGAAFGGVLANIDYGLLFVGNAVAPWLAAAPLVALRGRLRPPPAEDASPTDESPGRRSPWRDGPFLIAMALALVIAIVFFQFFSTVTLYFESSYGFDEDTIGLLFAINPVLIVVFEMPLVNRLRKRAALPWIGIGVVLIGAAYGMLPLGTGLVWAALAVGVLTLGEMLESPLLAGFVAARAGPRARGAYMGVYSAMFALALLVAPTLGTWIYDDFGSSALWYGCTILGALAAAGFFVLGRAVDSRISADDA